MALEGGITFGILEHHKASGAVAGSREAMKTKPSAEQGGIVGTHKYALRPTQPPLTATHPIPVTSRIANGLMAGRLGSHHGSSRGIGLEP
uniref:Uncharacterized protein n=1 Tax=Oryza sativa subsp. japonica TaxID=39947 RepID=Q69PW1_ORYSJ|nr:hypothetical protein [Oryza sativa Japonica Group]